MKKYLYIATLYTLPAVTFAQRSDANSAEVPASSADSISGETGVQLQNPLKVDSFERLFQDILTDIIIPISAAIGVVFIIWAGFKFVTAQGNATEIQNARKNLIYVLIGVGLVIGAEVILDLLLNTLTQVADVNS